MDAETLGMMNRCGFLHDVLENLHLIQAIHRIGFIDDLFTQNFPDR